MDHMSTANLMSHTFTCTFIITHAQNAQSSLSMYGEENLKKQSETATAVVELKDQVNSMNDELTKLIAKLNELEVSGCEDCFNFMHYSFHSPL